MILLHRYIILFLFVNFYVLSFTQIPTQNLQLWLDGDSGIIQNTSGQVERWIDRRGSVYAEQTNSFTRPTLEVDASINHQSVRFDGVNDIMSVNFSEIFPQPNTFFIVWAIDLGCTCIQIPYFGYNSTFSRNNAISVNAGVYTPVVYSKTTPFNYMITQSDYDGINTKIYENGVLQSTINGGASPSDSILEIGGTTLQGGTHLNGRIAELIFYDTLLTNQQKLQIDSYLINKYSKPLNLGNDTIVCGQSINIGINTENTYTSITWSNGVSNVDSVNITANGTYWVTVESFGQIISDTIEISGIVSKPVIDLNSDLVLCVGDSVVVNYSPQPNFSALWSTGDSTNSLTIKENVYVFITHTDTNGCYASSDVFSVQVDSFSKQSTLGPDKNICNGTNLYVETNSNQGPFTYNWSTGDTSNYTTIPFLGVQDIYIEMLDFNSCVFKDTVQINSLNLPAPIVDFSFDTVCPSSMTHFTDLSTPGGTDNITDWKWNFGNSDSSFTQNSEYIFQQGVFNVDLTVITDSGCINTLIKQVRTHNKPKAIINTPILCAQENEVIYSTSIVDFPDFIANHIWDVDNNTYSTANPVVVISSVGNSEIGLIVTTNNGCTDSTTKQIEVFPALTADFSYTNNCLGDSITFTDETQSFSIVDWKWSFNGFNSSALQNPKFQYNTIGTQIVSLEIENAIGCKSSISKNIEITPQPIAAFVFDKACVEDNTLFYDNSIVVSDSIVSKNWEIETDLFNTDSINYIFTTEDDFGIYYSIETANGCLDDTSYTLTINPLPNPNFSFTPNYGTAPLEVSFNNETTDATLYNWNFGDNGNTTDENPSHTYTENGIYNVTLEAINEYNCSETKTQEIAIIPSELDIEIEKLNLDISSNNNNNIINANVFLSNVGTRNITNTDLILRLDNGEILAQKWTGDLAIGNIIDYYFDSYFIVPELSNHKYVCVEAINVNDGTEINLVNNKTCQLINGNIQFSNPYPNPVNNFVNIDIVTSNKGVCQVSVVNMLGENLYKESNIKLLKGYNQLQIETATYQSGKYFMKISYLDEDYLYSFVVK